jgi:hypothetical protein
MIYDLRVFRENIFKIVEVFLGEYTYPNGDTAPALFVKEGNSDPGPGISVSGLEVTIEANPGKTKFYRQYQGTPVANTYYLRLAMWGPGTCWDAAMALVAAFDGATYEPITVPEGLGPTSQGIVLIPQNFFDTAAQPARRPAPSA